ncbi:LysR family transcriptional regulator [Phenylobacterium sp.]|uniref:LysR family transcriptional regulator n=1 Tax=Phenylobacterium sp. TaxID=1871053 RepID=UPI00289A52F9|nr:LysR family transcriptional regulator [Phenylobacterium sp.]
MSDFDINQVRRLDGGLLLVFRELVRRRKAQEAALALGLSPSAVSHALTRLRDLFGDPLFVRKPHGLVPTRRALELEPQVEALLALAGATLGRREAFDPAASRRVFRMSAPEFVTDLIGGRLLNALAARAPGVIFTVEHMTQDRALEALRRGEIDLAVGRFAGGFGDHRTEALYEDRYCVAARRGHPRIEGAIDARTYATAGHVYAMAGSETAGDENLPNPLGMTIAARAGAPHWMTVLVMVAASDAIATCPRRLAERHAAMLGLQVLDPPFEPMRLSVEAVRRAGTEDAGVDWFLGQVRAAAG